MSAAVWNEEQWGSRRLSVPEPAETLARPPAGWAAVQRGGTGAVEARGGGDPAQTAVCRLSETA